MNLIHEQTEFAELPYIKATRTWVESVVVGLNLCPFAKKELLAERIKFCVVPSELESLLVELINECHCLDQRPEIETTLMIIKQDTLDFDEFLFIVDMANALLVEYGYEGIYQLAHFHPQYSFEGSEAEDPSNFTNRAPYPTLHLLREESIERVLEKHPNPDAIPEANIEHTRKLGLEHMRALLQQSVAAANHGI